jgi:exodeoxyribonuclease VII large subunit
VIDINSLRERDNTEIFSVSSLNAYIKNIFENNRTLSSVTLRGEISNFTNHRSGHLYFSLKDSEGQIRAVMFRSRAASLKFMPESGMKVIVHGSVTVYPRDGSYQIYVLSMQPDGIGALYLAYEQMKARLAEEGLFDESHKKLIPEFPRRIGVITSPTGAAVRDIINVTGRRYPMADLYLYPALVQGAAAEASLIRALDYLDSSGLCDVIIIGRGGGSIEDLWAFNSEALARRIYAASTPVISAVGHETDFTICDFVADMRAPTPSAAAEIAVPDRRELIMRLDRLDERMCSALVRSVARYRELIDSLSERVSIDALKK